MASSITTSEQQQLRQAVAEVAHEIADMIKDLRDTRIRLNRGDWTVGQAAAHIAISQELFRNGLEGGASPYRDGHIDRFAPVNEWLLEKFGERGGTKLADLIVERTESFLVASVEYPADHHIDYHFGRMDVTTWTSYMLFHLLMHTHPIAMALGRPSPLEPAHTDLVIPFLKAVMPRLFDKQEAGHLRAYLEFRIRGGRRFGVEIANGGAGVDEPPARRADCYVSADPVAFFLVVAGLVAPWGPIARGKLLAWGRRPWLALRVKSLFPNP